MLLVVDVGNTQITLGAYDGKRLAYSWRLRTDRHATRDELGVQLTQLFTSASLSAVDFDGICIASVVPPIDRALRQACESYLRQKPMFVGPGIKLGIHNRYKKPEEVGADRLVNAVAIHSLLKKTAIVVDFGTATTFDCVSAKGDYLGGVIAPGLEIAHESLSTRTAKLPRVPFEIPTTALGRTTKESLQSGLFWGYIGLIEGVLVRLKKEMKGAPLIVATGGLSTVIGPYLRPKARIMPELTLEGLRLLWERNQA